MNHGNDSPIGLTNEVAGGYTPTQDSAGNGTTGSSNKKQAINSRFLLMGEDLEKIRRSSHSVHYSTDEMMEDAEHDSIIKDLLYPALEGSSSAAIEFFEDDYAQAQAAVTGYASGTGGGPLPGSDGHHRGIASSSGNGGGIFGQSNAREGAPSSVLNQSSFMAALRRGGAGGQTYSDVSSEKVRR